MTNDPYIYDYLILPLINAQARAQADHATLADSLATLADTYEAAGRQIGAGLATVAGVLRQMSAAHASLAVAVPAVAQAAADLGTAAERHDVNNLRAVVVGEQGFAAALAADVEALKGEVRALHTRHDAADEWRSEILRLLKKLNGEAPDA